jgi:hypothetical protein
MSARTIELAQREAVLRLRCAIQRGELAGQVAGIEGRLRSVDRAVVIARSLLLRPAGIAGAAVLLLLLGRARTLRIVGRGLLLLATARRIARLL